MDTIDRIMALMQEKKMNGAELSRICDLGNAVFYQWKSRRSSPSAESLVKVAICLDTTVEYLTGQTEKKETLTQEGEHLKEVLGEGYFRVMQSAKDKGYTPDDMQLALDFLDRARKRDQN